jgi:drug/metabolite transporter (DMT)-like permease
LQPKKRDQKQVLMSVKPTTHVQAILYALSAYALWVFFDAATKLLRQDGLPAEEVLALVALFGLPLLILTAGWRGALPQLRPRRPAVQLLCGLMAVASSFCNIFALKHLSLTLFFILVFAAPLVVALLGAVWLKEPLGPAKIIAVFAGFAGVVIAVNPFGHVMQGDSAGYLAILCSVIAGAAYILLGRRVTQTESLWSMSFSAQCVGLLSGLLLTMLNGSYVPPSGQDWALFAASGTVFLAAQALHFFALRHTTAAHVAQCNYSQIIWASGLSYILWREIPNWHLAFGAALIIASGFVITAHARKADTLAKAILAGEG